MTFRSVSSITMAAGVGRWLLWTTSTPGGVVSAARTTSANTPKQKAIAARRALIDGGAKAPAPHDTYGLLTPLMRAMIVAEVLRVVVRRNLPRFGGWRQFARICRNLWYF